MENINLDNNISYIFKDKTEAIVTSKASKIELLIEDNANVKLVLMDVMASDISIKLGRGSNVSCDFYEFSDKLRTRNITIDEEASLSLKTITGCKIDENIIVNLNGYKASFQSSYLSFARDYESNVETFVNHNAKETKSNVKNYGVSLSNSGIKFKTTGQIERGNSASVCEQLTRGVIANENAYIKALPILLIDEYNVKANHGASIGKMSDDELFYLMSRGLSKSDAFRLILSGIVNPFLDTLIDKNSREKISESIYRLI